MRRVLPLIAVLLMGFAPAPFPKTRHAAPSLDADLKAMQGKWRRLSVESAGATPRLINDVIAIDGNQITYGVGEAAATTWTLTLGEGKPIRFFDIKHKLGFTRFGLYQLKGNTLWVCMSTSEPRPTNLRPSRKEEVFAILVRIKP